MSSLVGAQTWTAVGPPGNPSINALAVDPGTPTTLYAATTQGDLFVTTDAGATWTMASANIVDVKSLVAFLPPASRDVPLLYEGTYGGGVLKSSDRGLTWVSANNGLASLNVWSLAVTTQTGTLYAGTDAGVFRSTDNAASWVSVSAGLLEHRLVMSLSVSPSNPSTAFCVAEGTNILDVSLFRTTDGGAHWSSVRPSDQYRVFYTVATDPFFPDTVYAGFLYGPGDLGASGFGGLLKSTDGGRNWSDVSPSSGSNLSNFVTAIATDGTTPGRLYIGVDRGAGRSPLEGVFATNDFGVHWSQLKDPSVLHPTALVVAPTAPSTVYAGTGSGIFQAVSETAGPCTPGATTLCLQASRFRVEAAWSVPAQGRAEVAQTMPITSNTGAFWFFDPTNLELVVKVLDGRSINGKFWVFYGSLTNVEFALTVTDTQTGAVKTYLNPQGQLASVADTSAF